jgi:hypothetical protein
VAVVENIEVKVRREQKEEPKARSARKKGSRKSKNQGGDTLESTEIPQSDVLAPRRSVWKTSSSSGGRFLHLDPVFSQDEK